MIAKKVGKSFLSFPAEIRLNILEYVADFSEKDLLTTVRALCYGECSISDTSIPEKSCAAGTENGSGISDGTLPCYVSKDIKYLVENNNVIKEAYKRRECSIRDT